MASMSLMAIRLHNAGRLNDLVAKEDVGISSADLSRLRHD